jgi:hypothetical protein
LIRLYEPEKSRDERIREAILQYLRDYPLACDSIEGICDWWLREQGVIALRQPVERVVAQMVDDGELRRIERPDGHVLITAARP